GGTRNAATMSRTITATTRMIAVRFRFEAGAATVAGLPAAGAMPSGGDSWAAGLGTRSTLERGGPPRGTSVFDPGQEPGDQSIDDQGTGREPAEQPSEEEERGPQPELFVDPVTCQRTAQCRDQEHDPDLGEQGEVRAGSSGFDHGRPDKARGV